MYVPPLGDESGINDGVFLPLEGEDRGVFCLEEGEDGGCILSKRWM